MSYRSVFDDMYEEQVYYMLRALCEAQGIELPVDLYKAVEESQMRNVRGGGRSARDAAFPGQRLPR